MNELKDIRIKMKALGLTERQIDDIIKKSLPDKSWAELSINEKKEVVNSLNERITFTRKFLKGLSCNSCCK